MQQSEKLAELVKQAQGELDAALAAGEDTAATRQRLRLAQEELERSRASEAEQAAEDATAADLRIEAEVARESAQVRKALTETLNHLASLTPPVIDLPTGTLDSLIRARLAHEQALAAWRLHREKVNSLDARLQGLMAERERIISRRAQGVGDDVQDAPRLALIDADTQGLRNLIAATEAAAPPNPDTTAAEVQRIGGFWQEAQEQATLTALNGLCSQLESRLLQVAETLLAKGGGIHGYIGLRWRPDQRLRNAVLAGVF